MPVLSCCEYAARTHHHPVWGTSCEYNRVQGSVCEQPVALVVQNYSSNMHTCKMVTSCVASKRRDNFLKF